jgi:hypothetical protein
VKYLFKIYRDIKVVANSSLEWKKSHFLLRTLYKFSPPKKPVRFSPKTVRVLRANCTPYRVTRGRCYDRNFLRFLPIFGKKLSCFSKTNLMMANRKKPIFAPLHRIADNGAIFPIVCRIDPLAPYGGSFLKPKQIK